MTYGPTYTDGSGMTQKQLRRLFKIHPATGLFLKILRGTKKNPLGGTCNKVGTATTKGYIEIMIEGRRYSAARLMWLYDTGSWPPGKLTYRNGYINEYCIDNLKLAGAEY